MKSKTFIEMCVRGERAPADIDAFVEAWHMATGEERSLRESLGLTAQEYADWVSDPESLSAAIERRNQQPRLARIS